MNAFLSMTWQLVSLRAGPDSLPYRPRLVPVLLVLNLLLSALVQQMSDVDMERPVLVISALSLAADALWLAWLLQRRQWRNRWVQSYSALVLVDMFITALATPLVLVLQQLGSSLLGVVVVLQFVMTLWSVSVRGFIFQSSLEVGRWRGILFAMAPLFAVMVLTLQLFPELLPAAPQGH